jgi:hypothetical protein
VTSGSRWGAIHGYGALVSNLGYARPVHMIKLTATQEITPYQWVHPDRER